MVVDPLISAASSLIGKLVGEMVSALKKPAAAKLDELRAPAKIRALAKKLSLFEQVKTLSNPEKPQKIGEFYLAPKFSYPNGRDFSVEKIEDFGIEEHPLIEGIAGQGKSMFMRQIFVSEVREGKRLPILLELRRITTDEGLLFLILQNIKTFGFPAGEFVWKYLASEGKVLLLLDGFDELKDELRTSFVGELERLIIEFPELKLIITSRPEAAIRGVPFFRSVTLKVLDNYQKEEIIKKICVKNTADSLLDGLKKNPILFEMIDTPLFVTLLCVAYRAEQYIPETTHELYDLIFNTLLYRHDAFKPGFDRPRRSGLGNHQFCKVFENFCFLSLKDQRVRMSDERASAYIKIALKNENIVSVSEDKYFHDLVKITCLFVQDGIEYQFLHKSIQDYFCAKYIKGLPDATAEKFYAAVLKKSAVIGQFTQVLRFLRGIDTHRYTKYFEIPACAYVFGGDFKKSVKNIDKLFNFNSLMRFINSDAITIHLNINSANSVAITRAPQSSYDLHDPFYGLVKYYELEKIVYDTIFRFCNGLTTKDKEMLLDFSEIDSSTHLDEYDMELKIEIGITKMKSKTKFLKSFQERSDYIKLKNSITDLLALLEHKEKLSNELDLF